MALWVRSDVAGGSPITCFGPADGTGFNDNEALTGADYFANANEQVAPRPNRSPR